MLDDYNPKVLSYHDGQRYVVLPANHRAVEELADAGVRPVGMNVIHERGGKAELTFFAEGFQPNPVSQGNGGSSESRELVYDIADWKRVALNQRRFRGSGP